MLTWVESADNLGFDFGDKEYAEVKILKIAMFMGMGRSMYVIHNSCLLSIY